MTKFKFGDKVLKGDDLHVIVGISTCDKKACIAWIGDCLEPYWVDICELTKVSDWIQCSERMPENGDVLWCYNSTLVVGCHNQYIGGDEILVSGGGYLLIDNIDDAMWMPLPEMPEVKE